MPLEYQELTDGIIAAAIEVHRELGPGFVESVYENALCVELRRRKIPFSQQVTVTVLFRGTEVGLHRLDLLVHDRVVVELKAVKQLEDVHFVIVRSYLRAVDRRHGLILNFAKETLNVKRVGLRQDRQLPCRPPGFLGS